MEIPPCILPDPAGTQCDDIQVPADEQAIQLTMHPTQTQ